MSMQASKLAKIEGLLFVTGDDGISPTEMAELVEISEDEVIQLLEVLSEQMAKEERGIRLARLANRYRLTTKVEHADMYKKLASSPIHGGLSRAALETLAIVAYKQPITRAEIDEVRGVKSEKALQSLVSKLLIEECGRASGTGRAILYGTTPYFLDHFGLESLADLPDLKELDLNEEEQDETDLFFEKLNADL
ncbi:SMC-Scp complex subunit ScpB [Shouchella clausii]|uniref:Segregation and condensation protein B n=3 Tax=Shouchella TaxID=2893057 RepID=SCPB_SHOC1|nr:MULTISPECIES: SMC-Scp complex subunit ScpB [Shouchella]Q5WH04.1 RecName: Full=Segregation and condensation protein B [Shouchella clausii KSM-K16]MCM3312590.1 SMC-Scp complex subunit ScpB [Psychrobacillus sp. MER TA 17]PAD42977.1 segregation/condensation protein B [Bacillus sp. 7520-S]SPU21818.1 transcriptional regulator [Niallia circulans]AST98695.1 segregation/condensation protein B [Shouchella clausii]KKI85774.1 segregation and condensation protein B [Shouchella clausii]